MFVTSVTGASAAFMFGFVLLGAKLFSVPFRCLTISKGCVAEDAA
jgi:hypothetical protein